MLAVLPKVCNEFAGPISAPLRQDDIATLEEMPRCWQAVGSTVSNLTSPRLYLKPPALKTNAFRFEQWPEHKQAQ